MHRHRCLRIAIGTAFCLLLLSGGEAAAQAGAGSIAGGVTDATGAALPGVTVEAASPALIEKVRTAVTDGQGSYRITELRPGVYTVTFTLTGFRSVRREGIELSAGFTAPVNAELAPGSIAETITVTGATPIVDVQSPRTQRVLTNEVLEALPSGQKDLTQLASLTLGAMPSSANRNDVGGDKGGTSTGISIHGSRGDDGRVSFDGHNSNVFFGGGGGQQTTYTFNTVAVAEQVVDMSGNSARSETGGANVNMVPREGANRFSFLGTVNYTNKSLSSGAVPDDLVARGSSPDQTTMKQVYDYGFGIGGPIVKDRLWFFSANRLWGNQGFAANNYFNKATNFYTYVPDLDRPAYQDTYFRDFGGRVTWQATTKQKLAFTLHHQRGCRCWQDIAGISSPDATFSFFYTPHYLGQAAWTYPVTNRLLLQAGTGYMYQGVQFRSFGAPDVPGRRRITSANHPGLGTYIWGGTFNFVFNDGGERQKQDSFTYFARSSYVTGSQNLEFGIDGQAGMFNQRGNVPAGGYDYLFVGALPLQITQYAGPFRSEGRVRKLGLYLSDQWTFGRVTLTGAVRYDHHRSYTLPIDIEAGPFIGARRFDAIDNVPNYHDISPRIGAAFDLFGNGKTAIRGSWGRYLVGLGGGPLTALSPGNAVVASAPRLWFDNPGGAAGNFNFFTGVLGDSDFEPDCDLTNFAANGECGPITTAGFGSVRPAFSWDESAREGWGIREFNYQWSGSLQHELRPGFGVSVGYYHTEFHNGQIQVNTALSASDFNYFCVTAPTDPRLGSASGQQTCGNVDQTLASLAIPAKNVWYRTKDAPVPGLNGERIDKYDGIELSMNLRFGNRGLLTGGLSLGRRRTDNCFANDFPQITGIVDQGGGGGATLIGLRDDKYCSNEAQALWDSVGSQVKFQAVYPLPYDFIVSGTYKHLPGVSLDGDFGVGASEGVVYTNALIAPSLGRNLSACGNVTGPCGQTREIRVVLPGELLDQRLNQIDLRVQRRFPIGAGRLSGVFEVYNVFNSRAPQDSALTWGAAPNSPNAAFRRPSLLLGGRLFKFGAQVDF